MKIEVTTKKRYRFTLNEDEWFLLCTIVEKEDSELRYYEEPGKSQMRNMIQEFKLARGK